MSASGAVFGAKTESHREVDTDHAPMPTSTRVNGHSFHPGRIDGMQCQAVASSSSVAVVACGWLSLIVVLLVSLFILW